MRTYFYEHADGNTYEYYWYDGRSLIKNAWNTKDGETNAHSPSTLSSIPTERQEDVENEITETRYYPDHAED